MKNILVNVELKSVVPEIRIWEVLDCGMGGELACAVGFDDFFAALDVVADVDVFFDVVVGDCLDAT